MTPSAAAEALFVSTVQPSDHPSRTEIRRAVHRSMNHFGGASGCAAACAEEYGEHPEEAAHRMQWALSAVRRDARPVAA